VFDGIRASIPKLELDDAFASKDEIVTQVLTDLRTAMSEYGCEVTNMLITDITPDKTVQTAMNEINGKPPQFES
jgi:regulator of protease activity HflC (stomatin/prohibitin superfamily)